jgi:hypothetical protein
MVRDRTVSVGVSRLFRLLELAAGGYRVEQAVRDPLTRKWAWKPLALVTEWNEAHGALHQMQADFGDRLERVQNRGFNASRFAD